MSELRRRMIQDMRLAGLSVGTQTLYVRAVRQLAEHYRIRPDRLAEEQVRLYLVGLIEDQKVARGTFLYKSNGLRFFYVQTLDLDWALFCKKNSARRNRSVCRGRSPTPISSN